MNPIERQLRTYFRNEVDAVGPWEGIPFDMKAAETARARRRHVRALGLLSLSVLVLCGGVAAGAVAFEGTPHRSKTATVTAATTSAEASQSVSMNGTTCLIPVNADISLLKGLNFYSEPVPSRMAPAIRQAAAAQVVAGAGYGRAEEYSYQLVLLTNPSLGLPGPGRCPEPGVSTIYKRPAWIATTPQRPTDRQSIFASLPPDTKLAPERDVIIVDAVTGEVLLLSTVS